MIPLEVGTNSWDISSLMFLFPNFQKVWFSEKEAPTNIGLCSRYEFLISLSKFVSYPLAISCPKSAFKKIWDQKWWQYEVDLDSIEMCVWEFLVRKDVIEMMHCSTRSHERQRTGQQPFLLGQLPFGGKKNYYLRKEEGEKINLPSFLPTAVSQ